MGTSFDYLVECLDRSNLSLFERITKNNFADIDYEMLCEIYIALQKIHKTMQEIQTKKENPEFMKNYTAALRKHRNHFSAYRADDNNEVRQLEKIFFGCGGPMHTFTHLYDYLAVTRPEWLQDFHWKNHRMGIITMEYPYLTLEQQDVVGAISKIEQLMQNLQDVAKNLPNYQQDRKQKGEKEIKDLQELLQKYQAKKDKIEQCTPEEYLIIRKEDEEDRYQPTGKALQRQKRYEQELKIKLPQIQEKTLPKLEELIKKTEQRLQRRQETFQQWQKTNTKKKKIKKHCCCISNLQKNIFYIDDCDENCEQELQLFSWHINSIVIPDIERDALGREFLDQLSRDFSLWSDSESESSEEEIETAEEHDSTSTIKNANNSCEFPFPNSIDK